MRTRTNRPRTAARRTARRRVRAAGFTLMELMTVIFVIAISATLAGPAFRSATVERINGQASLDLVRLMRSARSEAVAYGRAHIVRFAPTAGGIFRAYRGFTSSCTNQITEISADGWDTVFTDYPDCAEENSMCMDYMVMNSEDYVVSGSTLNVSLVDKMNGADETGQFVDICFEPRGAMYWRRATTQAAVDAAALLSSNNTTTLTGGFLFEFTRKDGTVETGVKRYVAVPLGANARLLR